MKSSSAVVMFPALAVRLRFPLVVIAAVELMLRPAERLMAAARLALPRAVAWMRSELVPAAEKVWLPLRPVRRALLARVRLPAVAAMVVPLMLFVVRPPAIDTVLPLMLMVPLLLAPVVVISAPEPMLIAPLVLRLREGTLSTNLLVFWPMVIAPVAERPRAAPVA